MPLLGYEAHPAFGVEPRVVNVLEYLKTDEARAALLDPSAALYTREVTTGCVLHAELGARTFKVQD